MAMKNTFDLVHELSYRGSIYQINPFREELIDAKVRDLLETTYLALYIGRGPSYYVAMEASLKLKRFLTSNVKVLRLENSSMEPLP